MKKERRQGFWIVIIILLLFLLITKGYGYAQKHHLFSKAPVETSSPDIKIEVEATGSPAVTESPDANENFTPDGNGSGETQGDTEEIQEAFYIPDYPPNNDPMQQIHPKAPRLLYAEKLTVPDYDGQPYILLNDGEPFFDTKDLKAESYEVYYDLDDLGRCTLADAVVGKDMMPTEKRGSISSVKPTGWHTDKYEQSLVDGQSLYNRCHLIAFGMCGETANPYNLVTGTRYFNTKGVNDFENMVIDYVRETDNHVRYRVTPIFTGDNLVCDGQIVEAYSIEDEGEGICFNIYAYNVQPGIAIDYATGDNWLSGEEKPIVTEPEVKFDESALLSEDYEGNFILNVKTKKIHVEGCEGAEKMSEKNRQEYFGSYNDLIRDGYTPDYYCLGGE